MPQGIGSSELAVGSANVTLLEPILSPRRVALGVRSKGWELKSPNDSLKSGFMSPL